MEIHAKFKIEGERKLAKEMRNVFNMRDAVYLKDGNVALCPSYCWVDTTKLVETWDIIHCFPRNPISIEIGKTEEGFAKYIHFRVYKSKSEKHAIRHKNIWLVYRGGKVSEESYRELCDLFNDWRDIISPDRLNEFSMIFTREFWKEYLYYDFIDLKELSDF